MDRKNEIYACLRDAIADGLLTTIKLGDFKKTCKRLDTPQTQAELEDFLQDLWDQYPPPNHCTGVSID